MKTNSLNFKTLILLLTLFLATERTFSQGDVQVKTFTNNYGWTVGNSSQELTFFGEVAVFFEVKKSTLTGKHYYVANIENISNRNLSFGARLTDRYPERTHFSVNIAPGEIKKWGEHLIADTRDIYVLISKPR